MGFGSHQTGGVERLRQEVEKRIAKVRAELVALINGISASGSGTGAPVNAQYVTLTTNGTLTSERVLTAGTNITITDNGAGSTVVVDAASGAPVNAQYVCLATNATLTAERVLTAGNGIDITDAGANGNVTIDVDESELAMQAPQYLCLANTAALPNERRLVAGTGIALIDNGAGSTCEVWSVFFVEDAAGFNTIDPCTNLTFDQADGFVVTNPSGQQARIDLADIPVELLDDVVYEVDFSTLANNTLTNGTEVIDGISWTVAEAADCSTFAIQNGTGLRMVAAAGVVVGSTFTDAAQVAPHLYMPLSSIPGYDARYDYTFEIYCSSLVHEATGEGVFMALWGPAGSPRSAATASVSRVRKCALVNAGGVRNLSVTTTATTTTGDAGIATHNVLSMRVNPVGVGCAMTGVWSAGWPAALEAGLGFGTSASDVNPFNYGTVRLVLGLHVANDASPTTAVTIQRLRIRRGI